MTDRNTEGLRRVLTFMARQAKAERLADHAPQLLAALEGCVEHMEWSTPLGKAAYAAALEAIAAAKGETA